MNITKKIILIFLLLISSHSRGNENLLFKGDHPPVLMETDYLDDPKRPGAVLGPRTIAKRTNELGKLLQMPEDEGGNGWKHEEISKFLWKIHHVWPNMLYGECR